MNISCFKIDSSQEIFKGKVYFCNICKQLPVGYFFIFSPVIMGYCIVITLSLVCFSSLVWDS